MPAGRPRNPAVAQAAKSASQLAKRVGLRRMRSRVKRSVLLRQALYRPYRDDRPTIDPELAVQLRASFTEEVLALDSLLGTPVAQRWGYAPGQVESPRPVDAP